MDFVTRDRYRHCVEAMARQSGVTEDTVARAAIQLATEAVHRDGPTARTGHVGFYLIDKGRRQLESVVHVHWSLRRSLTRMVRRFPMSCYLGPLSVITAATASLVLEPVFPLGWNDWRLWLLLMLGIISASQMAVALVNLLVNLLVGPRLLPRLDFSEGIPVTDRTMVVIPTLLTSPQVVTDLVEGLEIRYLGNRDPNLFFALLTDFRDAPDPTQPDDAELLRLVREGVESLNARYNSAGVTVFHLFHRSRVWNPHERLWMGYERKRGKLEQFNALLRGGPREPFAEIISDLTILPTIQYVLTLDTDTALPRDAARKLIGTMAHPLNRPRFDPPTGRVVEGYAIFQPRTPISLLSANRSRFAQLSAGEAGIDPYTREVSDVYQDLFAEGSYVGKGIYDVDAFRKATAGRFPENLILSHDLVESGYARSALVSDVELHEDHPANFADRNESPPSLDPGRLADCRLALAARARAGQETSPQHADRARPVENLRQPAPQPRAARAAIAAARRLVGGAGADRVSGRGSCCCCSCCPCCWRRWWKWFANPGSGRGPCIWIRP